MVFIYTNPALVLLVSDSIKSNRKKRANDNAVYALKVNDEL